MDYLFYSLGTTGDALPFLKMAASLSAKKYETAFLGNEKFETLAISMGVSFLPVSSKAEYERTYNNPLTWSNNNTQNHYTEFHLPAIKPTFKAIQNIVGQGYRPVIIYQDALSGARMAAEEYGLQSCQLVLAPSAIRSIQNPPYPIRRQVDESLWSEILPKINSKIKVDKFNKLIRPLINPTRRDLGLKEWSIEDIPSIESSSALLALFPSWLKPAPDDWPEHLINSGFILGDTLDGHAIGQLDEFVDTHGSPLVFTFGTGVPATSILIDKIRHICRSLSRPGVFVAHSQSAKFIENGDFPILVIPSAPFSYLFSRSAMVIHHGGIGTCAQALACGIPQLISPLTFDQPDNAFLLWQLGISNSVDFLNDSVEQINSVVNEVLSSESVRIKIKEYQSLTKDGTEASVQYLLKLKEQRATL